MVPREHILLMGKLRLEDGRGSPRWLCSDPCGQSFHESGVQGSYKKNFLCFYYISFICVRTGGMQGLSSHRTARLSFRSGAPKVVRHPGSCLHFTGVSFLAAPTFQLSP